MTLHRGSLSREEVEPEKNISIIRANDQPEITFGHNILKGKTDLINLSGNVVKQSKISHNNQFYISVSGQRQQAVSGKQ